MDKSRLQTLSDGVFAIVMTLLILDVRLPDTFRLTTNADFWRGLRVVLPNIGAYTLSFILISVFWNAHHTLFRRVVIIDGRLLWLNLIYLLLVTFIPYPTSLLAKAPSLAAAVQLYGLSLLATSLFHPLLLLYQRPQWPQSDQYDQVGWRRSLRMSLVAPTFYFVALVLTAVSVPLSYLPLVFVPLYYIVNSWTNRLPPPVSHRDSTLSNEH